MGTSDDSYNLTSYTPPLPRLLSGSLWQQGVDHDERINLTCCLSKMFYCVCVNVHHQYEDVYFSMHENWYV